ncbi:MAG: hypothetical protein HY649_09280 [Acidobacteria bacterium]|nr:hypothetical protein [Acidobacteriota bacterium]
MLGYVIVPGAWSQEKAAAGLAENNQVMASRSRITMGSSAGTPGGSVAVPIYFTPGDGVQIGQLKLEVIFVSANLKFSRFERGVAADLGNVGLSVYTRQRKNDQGIEETALTITASAASSEKPEKGLPPGLLMFLSLQVENDARPASITLHTSAQASELVTGNPVKDLLVTEAKVDVLEAGAQPLVVCFLFNH